MLGGDGTDTARCRGARRDGTPCQAPPHAVGPDGFCWAHSPTRREERRAARAKGGANRSTAARAEKLVPGHMRPVLDAVLAAIRDVRVGTLTPGQGAAIASLAGAAVRVYQIGVLEERIARLEEVREGRVMV